MDDVTYISVKEWSEKNDVSVPTAYNAIKRGKVPYEVGESGKIRIRSDFCYKKRKSGRKRGKPAPKPTYITPKEWGEKNGVSRTRVYSLLREGSIILPCQGKVTREIDGELMIREDAVRKDMSKPKGALAGKRVGNVEILEKTDEKQGTQLVYRCLCHFCGKEFLANGSSVINGDVYSCGCQRKQMVRSALESDRVDGTRPSILTSRIRSDNTSGHKGVALQGGVWTAYIDFKGERYYLGRYGQDYQRAVEAREQAEKEIFGGFLADLEKSQDADADERESEITEEEINSQKGVYYDGKRWRVATTKNGVFYYWGSFQRFVDARDKYNEVKDINDPDDLARAQKHMKKAKAQKKRDAKALQQIRKKENRFKAASIVEIFQRGNPSYRVARSIDRVRVYLGTYKDKEIAKSVAGIADTCTSLEEVLQFRDLLYKNGKSISKEVTALTQKCNCIQDLFLLINR